MSAGYLTPQQRSIIAFFLLATPILSLLFLLAPDELASRPMPPPARTFPALPPLLPPPAADPAIEDRQLARAVARAALQQGEAERVQAIVGTVGLIITVILLYYTHRSLDASTTAVAAAQAANESARRLARQWLDAIRWRCRHTAAITPHGGLHIRFRFKNTTHYPLTLKAYRLYRDNQCVEGHVDARLAPGDTFAASFVAPFTQEAANAFEKEGASATITGCAYFVDAFGEYDTTLFGRIIRLHDGKLTSMPYRGHLADRWRGLESKEGRPPDLGVGIPTEKPMPLDWPARWAGLPEWKRNSAARWP